MKKFDDEILMAYVDSELSEAERKEVELFLTEDAQARETVKRYRQTRTAIDQFADILDEPVPEHLVNTIRQHELQTNVAQLPDQSNKGSRWMAIAASLVIGVGLGTFTMNYLVVQPSEDGASVSANKIAELSDALVEMKAEREVAEKNAAIAEKSAAEAEKTVAAAKSKIDNMARALEIAQAEKEQAQEQVLAANRERPKEFLAKWIENIFPLKLVSEAIENGSKLSADMQKSILSELNRTTQPVTTASSFSKLIKKSPEEGLTTGASQYESLSDLQPVEPDKAKTSEQTDMSDISPTKSLEPKKVNAILGEFSHSGKTCRLFEYVTPHFTEASTLLACRNDPGLWKIIHRQYSR